jgi:hypothetical protein
VSIKKKYNATVSILRNSNILPPCNASRRGVGRFVNGNPGYSMNAHRIIPREPIKWPTCIGPGGIPRKDFAPSPSNALTVPYSSSSK